MGDDRADPGLLAVLHRPGREARLIVTYGCHLQAGQEDTDPVISHEHGRIGLFTRDEIPDLVMPQGYKDSIATWFTLLDSTATAAGVTGAVASPVG